MATDKKSPEAAPAEPAAAAGGAPTMWASPIIFSREKKRNKRKKYSRGSKGSQRLALGIGSAISRVARGFSDGAKNWVSRSKKSQRKRRDGLVRDAFKNFSRGFRKSTKQLAKAPDEITKRFNTRRGWRMVRVVTPF